MVVFSQPDAADTSARVPCSVCAALCCGHEHVRFRVRALGAVRLCWVVLILFAEWK